MDVGIAILIIFCFCIYFLPTIIAQFDNHSQKEAITILNFFLGWTLIGWVGALIWACIKSPKKEVNLSGADEIKKLAELKEQGILTEEEFEQKKKQILE